MKYYANLHTHSTHSDGKYTPTQLARMAKEEGYGAVAVTDHDTATAFPEFKAACDRLGLETVFGVEFSAPTPFLHPETGRPMDFHILGFHFDPAYPAMKEYLAGMSFREAEQTRILVERAHREGKLQQVAWEEVLEFNKGITWLCNEHVFRLMEAKALPPRRTTPDFSMNFSDPAGARYRLPMTSCLWTK